MKKIGRIRIICGIFVLIFCFMTACSWGKEEIDYCDDIPKLCEQELKKCFGEEYVLSEGVEKEVSFFDEYECRELITRHTEWELTYKDMDRQECRFTFNNRNGRMDAKEHLENSMENYFSDLVEQYYKENFWNQMAASIAGFREDDSVLHFRSYRLFSMPDVPETSVMFKERLGYSLAEHISFPELRYDTVFREFPYILNMYVYVTYESDEESSRSSQCRDTETKLQSMIDEMIRYTNGTLNATVHVTMMDEEGYADGFSFGILNGEYFADGLGIEYEMALHENFYT